MDSLGRYDPRSIGIVSTGDPEADAEIIHDHIRARALMDEGLCPNGCGPRVASAEYAGCSECPACGFFCNVPAVEVAS